MCNPAVAVGGLSFAKGAIGAMGAAAQAKERNRSRKQNYEHMLKVRKARWFQQLSVWGAKRNKYFTDINESDLAAQRGYSQAQVGISNAYAKAFQDSESSLIKYLQGSSSGKLIAAGRTGRSIQRLKTLDLGAMHRASGRRFYALTKTKEAYKANVEGIRNQQLAAQNKIWASTAFAPVPDLPPPPPQFEDQSPARGLILAGLGGVMSGLSVYSKFATGGIKLPTGGPKPQG